MSNPRPCWVCRSPKSEHDDPEAYKPAPRTEPLRARRDAWTLERMQEVMRSTGYTPRVENTYHLRAKPVRQPGHRWTQSDIGQLRGRLHDHQTFGGEHYIAVSALREFIETEAQALAECDYGVFNQGRLLQLDRIRERFCD